MKRIITLVLALSVLFTTAVFPNYSFAYGDDWSNASVVTLGNTASYTIDFENEWNAKFSFTAPETGYYTFTVVKQFEDTYSDEATSIYITDTDDSYVCSDNSEQTSGKCTVTASMEKAKNYEISVSPVFGYYDEGECTIELKAEKHTHSFTVKELYEAEYGESGYIDYECTGCGYFYEEYIPAVKSIKIVNNEFTYNGKAKKPKVTVKDSKGKALAENTDYTVTYKANKQAGLAKAVVKFKGKYYGTERRYFYIFPKKHNIKKLAVSGNTVTVKWKKQPKGVDGYEIQYSKKKNFKKKKRVYVEKRKKTSRKLKNLSYETKYYVRIRAYSNDNVHDQILVSSWSKVKSVKTGKKPAPKRSSGSSSGSGGGSSSGGSSGGSYYTGCVYITPTGECYHYSASCAGKNAIETSLDNAQKYYRPCSKCVG